MIKYYNCTNKLYQTTIMTKSAARKKPDVTGPRIQRLLRRKVFRGNPG